MAQKALFITVRELKQKSIISGSVDPDKIVQFVEVAQDTHIQNYLGTDLYDKISADILAGTLTGDYLELVNDYIQPMLIHFAMVEYLPFAAYSISNGGVYKHNSENSQIANKEEIDFLIQKERDFAEYYAQRFIDYMTYNAPSKFDEYYSNSNQDIYPDKDTGFHGWVL